MKKTTLLLFAITSMTFGQGITEDFEVGMVLPTASGWTQIDIAGGGDLWSIETGGNAPYYTTQPNDFFYSVAGCSGNYLHFNSDGFGDNLIAENAAIISPVFSCAAFTEVTIGFNHLFTNGFGGSGFVEVSTNGTTWTTVATYGVAQEFGSVTIDATSELAGAVNAQVRFRWVGNYSFGWALDNVSVYECTDSAPNAVINPGPADGSTNLAFDQTDPINYPNRLYFTWDNGAGDQGTSFTFNLGTTSPPNDIAFTGFPNGDFIYGFDYNTTYYWSIEAINCGGTSTPAIWSFTTEMDPALSTEDNVFNKIKVVALNKSIGLYNLPSSSSYNLYNMTGQEVLKGETNQREYVIEASSLASGVYVIELGDANTNAVIRKKVVLQ